MSEAGKAVFLSYASQDAEAAKRICEALRAAGVEVWFDQDALVGGDAWDAKIRGQIASCALFVPVISVATQSRGEGYFRLEWKLAVDRSHLMAHDQAFLLPVVIDATADAAARVPPEFRAVQWTRLPGGEAPERFCARVKKLLGGTATDAGPVADRAPGQRPGPQPKAGRRVPAVAWIAAALLLIAATGTVLWRKSPDSPSDTETRREASSPTVAAPKTASASEAGRLVAKMWEQLNKPELARAELEIADELGKRAALLDPNDAEVWAAWSQVDSWYVYHNFDHAPARREAARTKAVKALQLAPDSYEARLAQAFHLVRGGGAVGVPVFATEADVLLRALLRERPDEPRALHTLGILLYLTKRLAESRELFVRLAQNPRFAALAWNELGWTEFLNARDYRAADAAADASIALQPYWDNLILRAVIAQHWSGNLDRAKAALEQIPASVRQEDVSIAALAYLFRDRREPEAMLRLLGTVSREWLQSNFHNGPKACLAGLAHEMAGQPDAARLQWETALQLVEARLALQRDSGSLMWWKAYLLAKTGRRTEAETALRVSRELGYAGELARDAEVHVALGNLDQAITLLEKALEARERPATFTRFRLEPALDPLRQHPRFIALLTRLETDPLFSPTANAAR